MAASEKLANSLQRRITDELASPHPCEYHSRRYVRNSLASENIGCYLDQIEFSQFIARGTFYYKYNYINDISKKTKPPDFSGGSGGELGI